MTVSVSPNNSSPKEPIFIGSVHHILRSGNYWQPMSALNDDAATTLLSAYKPKGSLTTIVISYSPVNTTTEYRTITTTVSNEGIPIPTAPATTVTATTTPSPGAEMDTRPVDNLVADPASPPRRPAAALSANPAVVGGITGTFGRHRRILPLWLLSQPG
ncbi:uncharacterized protein PG998_006984 [Apiospora kogelbergensis]|uniref:Uncharacterized protein n=1 Tax=Apiospora kogelbergensis TaxID=1337665 RepID=A0AAW0QGE8_9PEZI